MVEMMEIDPSFIDITRNSAYVSVVAMCREAIPADKLVEYMQDADDTCADAYEIEELPNPDQPIPEGEHLPDVDMSSLSEQNVAALVQKIRLISTAISERTAAAYSRLILHLENFVREQHLLPDDQAFFCATPHIHTPEIIASWIMSECDNVNLDGTPKAIPKRRNGWSQAQKMRAAAAYAFGRLHGLGQAPWQILPGTNKAIGNPSASDAVQSYMASLRRRKAEAGEKSASARALTSVTLLTLFYKNKQDAYLIPPTTTSP
ncbi:hypothetical protein VKT23_006356 [Stygiomarasmius scandens]|uniref:Uncharacterized protein n=1 Tax=Marasmiellus scandens TaxID=2682957 RepID=A0ABR1JRX4_9AGAR